MSHRANGGSRHPWQAEHSRGAAEHHNQQQVQVEARAFDKHPLLLTHNQAAGTLGGSPEKVGMGEQKEFLVLGFYLQCGQVHVIPIPSTLCQQCGRILAIQACYNWLRNSRGDLRLHEDEDEHQQSGQTAGEHHPDGELTVRAQRVDDPATFVGTGHGETSRNTQFLRRLKTAVMQTRWQCRWILALTDRQHHISLTCVYMSSIL